MLWNPKHDNKALTLENFLAFVEAQDPEKEYDWSMCNVCAAGQWLEAIQHPRRNYPEIWQEDAVAMANYLAGSLPHTFGALAERVRADLSV